MKSLIVPKVIFEIVDYDSMMKNINRFLNPDGKMFNWMSSILNAYPDLAVKLEDVSDKEEREKIANRYFKRWYKENIANLESAKKLFQKEWNKINDSVMIALSEVCEISWSEEDKKIIARISANPICPRFLKYRAFDVYYKTSLDRMKEIACHEILHFIYFKKWKETFKDADETTFESPHIIWKLSEMVPKSILSDKRFQKVFAHEPKVYTVWYSAKIKGKPLLENIQSIYDKKKNFEDFLKKSYNFVKKNELEIHRVK